VYRQSDGRLTSRRGLASRSAAVAARAIAVEQVRRGEVRATNDTFGEFWTKHLEAKRPYVTPARSRTTGRRASSGCCRGSVRCA
jgi:hypothetical protein